MLAMWSTESDTSSTSSSHNRITAVITTRAEMHEVSFETYTWSLTANMHRASGGPDGATDYEYTGTGAPDNSNEVATLSVPVQPGRLYAFSAWVDPSAIAGGAFVLFIARTDGKSSYTETWNQVGSPLRYSTPAWQCPPDVTSVMLGMQVISPTVARGQELKFSEPILSDISPPQISRTWTGATHVAVPELFGDHAVLQRDAEVPVWGTADPRSGSIIVSIAGRTATAKVDAQGRWRALLSHLPVGGPYIMMITGRNTIAIMDVLVGDVYVASGQSNMAYAMLNDSTNRAEAARANDSSLREFVGYAVLQSTPQYDFHSPSSWVIANDPPINRYWSAVSYYFGKQLRKELGIPVGIISATVGATIGQAWMSADAVNKNPDLVLAGYGAGERLAILRRHPSSAGLPLTYSPSYAFNAMVNPMLGYGVKGVLWYQGEGNASSNFAESYKELLPALIADWRSHWGTQLPFYVVQLPGIGPQSNDPNAYSGLAFVRDAQLQTALTVPNTGLAIALDLGDAAGDLHPPDKADVGMRLAQLVLHNLTGPLYAGYSIAGSSIRIRFTHTDGGLIVKGQRLSRFAIAGADKHFVWANAVIDGDAVIVSSSQVPNPVAVRYAWADDPSGANLYSDAGLPASPFRTDDW